MEDLRAAKGYWYYELNLNYNGSRIYTLETYILVMLFQ